MRINNFFKTLLFIVLILSITVLYALYERKKYYRYGEDSTSSQLTLKSLPSLNLVEINSGKKINTLNYLRGAKGLYVHIWGSWCAPCEKEMPEFLAYSKVLVDRGIKVLLVAVNDDEIKIKKFMARFGALPSNVLLVLDKENKVMDSFGILKVPETFLFNSNAQHVNKFIGPQEWGQESFITRLDTWLTTNISENRKIETH
jgi:cytochrome c biogenesis protein CcmG/thiol:disulfide interchange protein DsbE